MKIITLIGQSTVVREETELKVHFKNKRTYKIVFKENPEEIIGIEIK